MIDIWHQIVLLFDSENNFATYKKLFFSAEPPFIPAIVILFLSDLLEILAEQFGQIERSQKDITPSGKLNDEKICQLAALTKAVSTFQKVRYEFSKEEKVQQMWKELKEELETVTEKKSHLRILRGIFGSSKKISTQPQHLVPVEQ